MFASYKQSEPIVSFRDPGCASSRWSYYHMDVAPPLQAVSSARLNAPVNSNVPSADAQRTDRDIENTPLTSGPSSRPPSRLSKSPALTPQPHNPPPPSALFPNQYIQHLNRRQNVPAYFVNASSRDQPGPSTVNHGLPRISSLESVPLSSLSPSQNGSIDYSSQRPRTSHPVFTTTSDLAAHHGIPQFLPPVPRTTRYTQVSSENPPSESIPSSSSTNDFDFSTICSSYLTMLSQKATEGQPAALDAAVPVSKASDNGAAVQALMEVLQASPEFQMAEDFNEFLTSPMDDSPWDDFLTTPAMDSADIGSDMLTSPAIIDADDFESFGGVSLFGDSLGLTGAAYDPHKASAQRSSATTLPTPFSFDDMYTMPSPSTPALDPTSLHPSPRIATTAPPTTPAPARRRNAPTGTRKNISPQSLVPIDAPIQPRKYVTPSATSRKEVPAVFAKKRARSQAFGEEDEPVDAGDLPESDVAAIEAKRRQNTLAARRSRKRKLEYQRELELSVEHERAQKEMWRARADMLEAMLRQHGHDVPLGSS